MQNSHPRMIGATALVAGMCPLALMADTVANALLMGGVFLVVLLLSSFFSSLMRDLIPFAMRLPVVLLITGCLTSVLDALLSAFYPELRLTLDIYLPLLAVNCVVLTGAETYAFGHTLAQTISRCFMAGLTIWGLLLVTGAVRSFISGSMTNDNFFTVFNSAPGAFLTLGFAFALLQYFGKGGNAVPRSERVV